jgi:hypothetical protein
MANAKVSIGTEEQRRFSKDAFKKPNVHCVYCGDWFQCRDHYIPRDWSGYHRSYAAGDVVPCCIECNILISNRAIFNVLDRAKYLISAYERKASKWLRIPPWSEKELGDMGYNMRNKIRIALMLRSVYAAKLLNLDLTAQGYDAIPIH